MDIDDTIFDFSQCAHRAFGDACTAVKITPTEDIWQTFCRIDVSLWEAQKEGRLTVAEVVQFRAKHFAKAINVPVQASAFQRALSAQTALVPGADHVIRSLSGRFPLFAASNGIKKPNPSCMIPNYEIRGLPELLTLLTNK